MKDGAVQEETALGIFNGDSMDEFALKEVDSEEYGKMLDTMPVNNKEKYASKSLVEEVCKDNNLGTYEQAQKDLGIYKETYILNGVGTVNRFLPHFCGKNPQLSGEIYCVEAAEKPENFRARP